MSVLIDLLGNAVGRAGGLSLPQDPQDAVESLGTQFRLSRRKQGQLYLLRYVSIPGNRREGLVGWPEIRSLRITMGRNQGYPSLEMLLRFSELSYAQLVHLLPEYGDVNINTDQLDQGRVWREILTFLRKLPAEQRKLALSQGGMAYRDAPEAARSTLGKADEAYHLSVVAKLNEDLNGARVRYVIEPGEILVLNQPGEPERQAGRKLLWEVTFSDGKVLKRYYPLQLRDKQASNRL